MRKHKNIWIIVACVIVAAIATGGWIARNYIISQRQEKSLNFNGKRAYQDLAYQVSLGSRVPGTPGHEQIVKWMVDELKKAGWQTEVQQTLQMGHEVQNVIAKRGQGSPWYILGAHYDTRMWADRDPDPIKARQPVPGADDGASGVAVLLELARNIPVNIKGQVWLVFFDAEDNGDIPGWDWSLGAQAIVQSLTGKPDGVVVLDMVGDKDLNIYMERNSDQIYMTEIWAEAALSGHSQFIPILKYSLIDDHTPFLNAGIRAVDIIDFDYPYWHTSQDTVDKVSAESLKAVGETVQVWLINKVKNQ
ncbi:MAG: M28 family peptidase [Omnitrophica WOR_2 bacterium]